MSAKRFDASPFASEYTTPNTIHGAYCGRLYPLSSGEGPNEGYWRLRRHAALYDVPEKPLLVEGPGSVALLERVLARRVANLAPLRARYALALAPDGGIVMDGVLIRLTDTRFLYVQADGDFELWLRAHAMAFDATVSDPRIRVLQIQGPRALDVLAEATGATVEHFGYFQAGWFDFGPERLLVTRTGWTGELGFEVYAEPGIDHRRLWNHLLEAGEPFQLGAHALDSMGIRRIEAGILDNGADMDPTLNPWEAGLGHLVDLDQPEFIGRDALRSADAAGTLRGRRIYGILTGGPPPRPGELILAEEEVVGTTTAGAWSPTLEAGVGYARFRSPGEWPEGALTLERKDGRRVPVRAVVPPFFDRERRLARGLPSERKPTPVGSGKGMA